MVLGFNDAKIEVEPVPAVFSIGKPSITINGSLLANKEEPPRF
jgi:hypothetical protein